MTTPKWVYVLALSLIALAACSGPASLPLPEAEDGEADFHTEELRMDTGPVTLAGTLLTPLTDAPAPAVVMVPGSGPATRDGSWNMYRSLGEYLVRRGLAVLLYDKRGVGASTGNWETETFQQRAQDVAWMVGYLQSRPEIDPARIGLVGHSQGAYIAPLVAARYSEDVQFVVLLAGSGETVWDQILTNERSESLAGNASADDVKENVAALESQLTLIRTLQAPCRALRLHYLCFVIDYDPAPALEALTVPTLAVYAALDTQVPPEVNMPLVASGVEAARNPDATFIVFENANHWFGQAETGTTAEMREKMQTGGLESYDFVPGFLETLGDWICARAGIDG